MQDEMNVRMKQGDVEREDEVSVGIHQKSSKYNRAVTFKMQKRLKFTEFHTESRSPWPRGPAELEAATNKQSDEDVQHVPATSSGVRPLLAGRHIKLMSAALLHLYLIFLSLLAVSSKPSVMTRKTGKKCKYFPARELLPPGSVQTGLPANLGAHLTCSSPKNAKHVM
ncbi:uncharacterized protein V6R79_005670 [Siganus canaliculatus]